MSFMYNPVPFDDEQAINRIHSFVNGERCEGFKDVIAQLKRIIKESKLTLIDGYISADFHAIEKMLQGSANIVLSDTLMKSEAEIEEMLKPYLPLDKERDPDAIFGKLYEGDIIEFFDEGKVQAFLQTVKEHKEPVVLIGHGSAMKIFREVANHVAYIDLTPKDAVLRAQKGCYRNIGAKKDETFKQMIRRYYYVDVEILMKLRKELVQNQCINSYLLETWKDHWQMMDNNVMTAIFDELMQSPFRTKPVYLEGIWGGEFMRKIRHVPMDVAPRIAWVFEFIPLEASIVAELDNVRYDIPFYTLLNAKEEAILGKEIQEQFHGNFPIRFNYDDTWHSDGNMSIQVHPNGEFAKANYNESNSQDEAYYVVATGHDALTYCGFKKHGEGFIELCAQAQKDNKEIDYRSIINSVPSYPGLQIMIPNGTVHSSGRNQVVLELGSYTVGAYTYKMYDYNRKDLDGGLRPIHLYNAEKVLEVERDHEWVKKHSIIEPMRIAEEASYKEDIIGRNEYMYYETHRIQLQTCGLYTGKNHGMFTVLSVVDGEKVRIYDKDNPQNYYEAKYLDVVTIPANIENYVVEALGYQPVTLHKTIMKREEETYGEK